MRHHTNTRWRRALLAVVIAALLAALTPPLAAAQDGPGGQAEEDGPSGQSACASTTVTPSGPAGVDQTRDCTGSWIDASTSVSGCSVSETNAGGSGNVITVTASRSTAGTLGCRIDYIYAAGGLVFTSYWTWTFTFTSSLTGLAATAQHALGSTYTDDFAVAASSTVLSVSGTGCALTDNSGTDRTLSVSSPTSVASRTCTVTGGGGGTVTVTFVGPSYPETGTGLAGATWTADITPGALVSTTTTSVGCTVHTVNTARRLSVTRSGSGTRSCLVTYSLDGAGITWTTTTLVTFVSFTGLSASGASTPNVAYTDAFTVAPAGTSIQVTGTGCSITTQSRSAFTLRATRPTAGTRTCTVSAGGTATRTVTATFAATISGLAVSGSAVTGATYTDAFTVAPAGTSIQVTGTGCSITTQSTSAFTLRATRPTAGTRICTVTGGGASETVTVTFADQPSVAIRAGTATEYTSLHGTGTYDVDASACVALRLQVRGGADGIRVAGTGPALLDVFSRNLTCTGAGGDPGRGIPPAQTHVHEWKNLGAADTVEISVMPLDTACAYRSLDVSARSGSPPTYSDVTAVRVVTVPCVSSPPAVELLQLAGSGTSLAGITYRDIFDVRPPGTTVTATPASHCAVIAGHGGARTLTVTRPDAGPRTCTVTAGAATRDVLVTFRSAAAPTATISGLASSGTETVGTDYSAPFTVTPAGTSMSVTPASHCTITTRSLSAFTLTVTSPAAAGSRSCTVTGGGASVTVTVTFAADETLPPVTFNGLASSGTGSAGTDYSAPFTVIPASASLTVTGPGCALTDNSGSTRTLMAGRTDAGTRRCVVSASATGRRQTTRVVTVTFGHAGPTGVEGTLRGTAGIRLSAGTTGTVYDSGTWAAPTVISYDSSGCTAIRATAGSTAAPLHQDDFVYVSRNYTEFHFAGGADTADVVSIFTDAACTSPINLITGRVDFPPTGPESVLYIRGTGYLLTGIYRWALGEVPTASAGFFRFDSATAPTATISGLATSGTSTSHDTAYIDTFTVTPAGTTVTVSPTSHCTVTAQSLSAFTLSVTATPGRTVTCTVWAGGAQRQVAATFPDEPTTISGLATSGTETVGTDYSAPFTVTPAGTSMTVTPTSHCTVTAQSRSAFTLTVASPAAAGSRSCTVTGGGASETVTVTFAAATISGLVSSGTATLGTDYSAPFTVTPAGTSMTVTPTSHCTVTAQSRSAFTLTVASPAAAGSRSCTVTGGGASETVTVTFAATISGLVSSGTATLGTDYSAPFTVTPAGTSMTVTPTSHCTVTAQSRSAFTLTVASPAAAGSRSCTVTGGGASETVTVTFAADDTPTTTTTTVPPTTTTVPPTTTTVPDAPAVTIRGLPSTASATTGLSWSAPFTVDPPATSVSWTGAGCSVRALSRTQLRLTATTTTAGTVTCTVTAGDASETVTVTFRSSSTTISGLPLTASATVGAAYSAPFTVENQRVAATASGPGCRAVPGSGRSQSPTRPYTLTVTSPAAAGPVTCRVTSGTATHRIRITFRAAAGLGIDIPGSATPQIWVTTARCAYSLRIEPTVTSTGAVQFVISTAVIRYSAANSPVCPGVYGHAYSGPGQASVSQFAEGLLATVNTCTDPTPGEAWRIDFAHIAQTTAETLSRSGCAAGVSTEGDTFSTCVRARVAGGSALIDWSIRWSFDRACTHDPPLTTSLVPPDGVLVPSLGDVTDWSWSEAWARVSNCWESDLSNPVQSSAVQEWWDRGAPDWLDPSGQSGPDALGTWWDNAQLAAGDLWDGASAVWASTQDSYSNLVDGFGTYTAWAVGAMSCTLYEFAVPRGAEMNALIFSASDCELLVREDGTLETGADFSRCGDQASITLWWLSGLYGIGAPATVWDCRGPNFDLTTAEDIIVDDILRHDMVMGDAWDMDLDLSGRWFNSCAGKTMGNAASATSSIVEILQFAAGVLLMLGFARAMPWIIAGKG